MTGLVIRGSRNIFTLRDDGGGETECRIKGKVLKGVEGYYNPLAPGDRVEFEPDPEHPGTGLILSLLERRNAFTRFNQKGQSSQLLAANVDVVFCVTTPASPPFRPRFLDRALLQGDIANIPPVVVCNKYDLSDNDPDVEERLEDFIRIGYRVLRVSAHTGEGLDEFRDLAANRFSVLVGQSGVGKSSIINALAPGMGLKTGALTEKYDRGSHTTTMARLVEIETPAGPARITDTPGVRRLVPDGIGPGDLVFYMREFAPLAGRCSYGLSCTHVTEPGCKIMEAVAAGVIHEDRYESFLRIREELFLKESASEYGKNP
ncbi:ribosome small subunit-dependent GTPase A [Breznakiella homolactica]|uniref:Small ribosomal subunit biogenesis GTPase RsgA n=1 Tax=Breznakiella homolactica TaxID=2798577 RepID=A0A7T7XLI2_9SPIR|nr:ribosome small subunit-dependent GTPase A [Breznakiella homolactica]QQO08595.1 ribosome small subunit-dependent GTPase A [Breznakiella homolactica]